MNPREVAPPQTQLECKLKSLLLDFCYKQYLAGKSDEQVIEAVRKKNLPRIEREDWWRLKHFFRQKEMAQPYKMALIRRKIGARA